MNIKTVSVTYERKQNLGDFSSANVGCTIWADVREDEDLHQAMNGLWNMAKANVKAQLVPLTKNGSTNVEQLFLGLPVELTAVPPADSAESKAKENRRQVFTNENLTGAERFLVGEYEDYDRPGFNSD